MKVFIGYDSREDIAYEVCRYSIFNRQHKAEIYPLNLKSLVKSGIYYRPKDELGSTEFTFSRFLVPYLCEFKGWALFVDCDFLFLEDVSKIFQQADSKYAVMVAKHSYTPKNKFKMDGKEQHLYPRKNWSSLMLFNCCHPKNKSLDVETVNEKPGSFLHRFQWLDDEEIGQISHEWNWLVNWYHEPNDGKPKAIHYTEGGPWFENYLHCEYGALWEREKQDYLLSINKEKNFVNLPPDIVNVFNKILLYRIDPKQEYYNCSLEEITSDIKKLNNHAVISTESDEIMYKEKNLKYDPLIVNFITGSGGQISTWDKIDLESKNPILFRGILKFKNMEKCRELKRDFFYIDTGYFGNEVKRKIYHRIVKNNLQNIGQVINRPKDRLRQTKIKLMKFKPGKSILLCPPSEKVMKCFNLNLDDWIKETIKTIQTYSDRPIILRKKQERSVRMTTDTIQMALAADIHCLVTFNSIAATEALILGKPAFTLGPNAAQSLCLSDLSQIDKPFIPTLDEVENWAAHLAYCQFTEQEMKNGLAWEILNENSNLLISSS